MAARFFAAADLGATSGRVILGRLTDGRFELTETARFANTPIERDGHLHWDFARLADEVTRGFQAAYDASGGRLESLGIDTWGVDYGRLDPDGTLFEPPFNYRDARTDGAIDRLFAELPADELYARAGLQVQPFNTVFQLVAAAGDAGWEATERILLMPDLLAHHLTGASVAEVTNASTTALLDVGARAWSPDTCALLADRFGVPVPRILPTLVEPGTVVGLTRPGLLPTQVPVVAVGSHDTASAVVSVPATGRDFAFVSSGTWSLVGLELDAPILTPESAAANFTNELGVDHTVRFLKNVMGMWVLSECQREWAASGLTFTWQELDALTAAAEPLACVLDMDDQRLIPPGRMVERLQALAVESGQRLPDDPPAIARCIVDSLALSYRRAVAQACALAGRHVEVIHIVGGGSRNGLLCQLTAEATGLPVIAGPDEGTALGNLLVQARAMGALSGGLDALRAVSAASSQLTAYTPGVLPLSPEQWDAAARLAHR